MNTPTLLAELCADFQARYAAHTVLLYCSGSLKPDTHLGGIVATKVEVIHGQTTSFLFY